MPEVLQALHRQQEQERHTLEQEQRQEQEQLLHHQQQTFQEQEQKYIRLQNEYHQDPTPHRAHEIMMLEQEGKHSQELFAQQRQHVLERQQQDRLRMQERQWAQEHIAIQQIQAQQLLQQQQQHQQHQQHQHRYQEQQHHHYQEPQHPTFQQQHQHQLQQHDQQQYHHQQQHTRQTQQHTKESDSDSEAMDVDDEVGLYSIASTITNLRQHIKPGHTSPSVGAWAEGAATQRRSDDNDPDAAVILDTNILISHLNFFQALVNSYGPPTDKTNSSRSSSNGRRVSLDGLEKPEDVVFVVPWIVMQELDGLKGGGRQGSDVDVSGKARLAIEFLRAELSKQSSTSRLRGQKMSELVAKAEANDDKILDCCQYFRILYPDPTKTRIILFTNDKNLSVKAMVHEVEVISRFTVQLELSSVRSSISRSSKDDNSNDIASPEHSDHSGGGDGDDDLMMDGDAVSKPSNNNNSKNSEPRPKNGSRKNSSRSLSRFRAEHNDRELQRIKSSSDQTKVIPDGMDPSLFRLTNHVLKNLCRFLEAVVPDHLQARYGAKWKDITNFDKGGGCIKEEEMKWDSKRLTQPVKIMQEHWVVFADAYERPSQARKARESVDRLQSFVKTWTRVEVFGLGKVYKKDVKVLLEDVDVVLSGVTTLPDSIDVSSLPGTASFYDARNRIALMKDWRAECDRLQD
ncbi:RNA endoribonuclease [Linnemannia schmuckeri]|uniref:RNA endoribonuclease n=1 Tax=Linnemannia schmuckeri TaxID=64567 RepID=A0A9P5S139_9FUNG|nr:RNA endoribonuclease [Linnemannia schmuckeri]